MSDESKILDLYYNKHYNQINIAKELGTTRQRVSKIIKKDQERYNKEQKYRESYSDERIVNISSTNVNSNNPNIKGYRISIPNNWIKRLGFTDNDKQATIKIINDKQIIIEKYNKEEVKYERQNIAIAEKIYNEVLDFIKHQQSLCTYSLVKRFKIGYTTAQYLIDKLNKEGLLELKYGTYWVKNNN